MMEDEKPEKMIDPSPPPHHAPASTESELHRNSFSNPADTSKAFKYEELVAATNGSAPSNLLGSGGFWDGVQGDHSRRPCGGEAAQNRKSSR
ncbi:unnamed protein product [Calypogeia fissa]